MIRFFVAAMLAMCVWISDANAHTRSTSQSRWSIDGDTLEASVQADALDVTRLYALGGNASLEDTFKAEVAQAFHVKANGQSCTAQGEPRVAMATPGRLVATERFICPAGALAAGEVEIESNLFFRVAASHLHFVALRDAKGGVAEAILTEPHPRATLSPTAAPQAQSFWSTVAHFLPVGAEHVWTGLDHCAFILALVLLVGGNLRRVIIAATGFTLGHTATLGFAAAGVLKPDQAAIEALIGFTIAFVALEAGESGKTRMKTWSAPLATLLVAGGGAAIFHLAPMSPLVWFGMAAFVYVYPRGFPQGAAWLAMIFGLIHGCGFAGALTELDLPKPRLIASLMGFNLGVEFGQITIIVGALIVATLARRAPEPLRHDAAAIAGAALFALGAYWFVSRLFV